MSEEPLLPSEVEVRNNLLTKLDALDAAWKEYEGRVRSLLDEWEKVKIRLLEKISKAESLLRAVNTDLEKMNVELALGLLNEDEVRNRKAELESRKSKLEARLKALQEIIEIIESRLSEHLTHLKVG